MLLNVILGIAVCVACVACVAGAVVGELVINHGVIRMLALLGGVIGGYLVVVYRSKTPTSIPQS
jgi:hypothetical protein